MTDTLTTPKLDEVRGTWVVDAAHSLAEFRVKYMMIVNVKGRFDELEGVVDLKDPIEDSTIDVTFKTASISTNDEKRDGHLRSPDFFDVARYPSISFESTQTEHVDGGNYRVTGNLTMHGETQPVTLDVTVHGVVQDPQGQERVGLEVRGTVSRSEFGLRWQQVLESGGVLVADEIRIAADVAAVCSDPDAE